MCLNGFGGQGVLEVETPVCALSSGAGGGAGGQGRPHGCGWEEDEKLESGGTISGFSFSLFGVAPRVFWVCPVYVCCPWQILSCGGAGGLGLLGAAE